MKAAPARSTAWRLDQGADVERVCLKICAGQHDWRRDAYFGELLAGRTRVVQVLDAFVEVSGSGLLRCSRGRTRSGRAGDSADRAELPVGDAMRSWLWRAVGARSNRYLDAPDALHALTTLHGRRQPNRKAPGSRRGHRLAFSERSRGDPSYDRRSCPASRCVRTDQSQRRNHRAHAQAGTTGGEGEPEALCGTREDSPGAGDPHHRPSPVRAAGDGVSPCRGRHMRGAKRRLRSGQMGSI